MNFSEALTALKEDKKLTREGWNGKGMWVEVQRPTDTSKMTRPYIFMVIPISGTHQFDGTPTRPNGVEMVPWLVSQTDLMAEDWFVIDSV